MARFFNVEHGQKARPEKLAFIKIQLSGERHNVSNNGMLSDDIKITVSYDNDIGFSEEISNIEMYLNTHPDKPPSNILNG